MSCRGATTAATRRRRSFQGARYASMTSGAGLCANPRAKKNFGTKLKAAVRDRPMGPPITQTEETDRPVTLERPREGVVDDESAYQLRSPPREAEADGAAPVLNHHGQIGQRESVDEAFQRRAVLSRREAVARRGVRHPIAGAVIATQRQSARSAAMIRR